MKKVVERDRNKTYYRALHLPIWVYVFFILPGNLTFDLYLHGPDRRHWIWLGIVFVVCIWRGIVGRLPGVEPRPYVTYWGVDQPNLWYRVVCYTAAWIDLVVPYTLNLLGLLVAAATGRWMIAQFYAWLYYPLAAAVVLTAILDRLPRTRRSTIHEGAERAWFYVAIWTVVPSQLISWLMWRMGSRFGIAELPLNRLRLAAFVATSLVFFFVTERGRLPRTQRYYAGQIEPETADASSSG